MQILHRKRIESKIKEWIKNGIAVKKYRQSLKTHLEEVKRKFEEQQKAFRLNYPTIQSSKHL